MGRVEWVGLEPYVLEVESPSRSDRSTTDMRLSSVSYTFLVTIAGDVGMIGDGEEVGTAIQFPFPWSAASLLPVLTSLAIDLGTFPPPIVPPLDSDG